MNQKPYQAAWNKKNIERRRVWNREWIKNNRDRYNASKARYRIKLKQRIMLLYSDPVACARCGFTNLDGLVLDHVNNDGAKHRKEASIACRGSKTSGSRIYEYINKHGKIEGLQVLCANCNTIKQLRKWRRECIKDDVLHREIERLYGYHDS